MAKEIIIPETRDFKGVWIYKNLYLSREYTPNEKFLLLEIYSLSKGSKKQCYANNRHFADFIGVKENTIQKAILKLEKNGHIKRGYIYREGTKEITGRIITLTQKFYDDFINESEIKEENEGVDKNPQGNGNESTGGSGEKSIHKYSNYDLSDKCISNTYNALSESKDSSRGDIYAFSAEKGKSESDVIKNLAVEFADCEPSDWRIEELKHIIDYFLEQYSKTQNMNHIRITEQALTKIVINYFEPVGNYMSDNSAYGFDDYYKELIDYYLQTKYKINGKEVTKSLQHFMSGMIRENLAQKYLK